MTIYLLIIGAFFVGLSIVNYIVGAKNESLVASAINDVTGTLFLITSAVCFALLIQGI